MRIVALVPMKEHSERVPNKNLRIFAGKPLCEWVLRMLLELDEIENIYVDTDSEKISEIVGSISDRVQIIERSDELCGDLVSMNRILEYDIQKVEADVYLQTHSTNPLLASGTVKRALKAYFPAVESEKYDSLFTVTRHQTRFYQFDGKAVNHDPKELIPTQHLSPLFEENSNLYIFSRKSFSQTNSRLGARPMMFEVNRLEAVDIDEWADFLLAEAIESSGMLKNIHF